MDDIEQKEKVIKIILPVVKDCFYDLLDIEINKNKYLRVIIDKKDGKISLNDCSLITKKILELSELDEILGGNFTLEVSSPGIERPLIKKEDFERFKGNKVKIVTKSKVEGKNVFEGLLKGMDENKIVLQYKKEELKIDFNEVKKANLKVDF